MPPKEDAYHPYIARDGDALSELLYRRGADPDRVWNAPQNAALKASRCHIDMLHPCDVIYVPPPSKPSWLPVKIGATNAFVATPYLRDPYPVIALAQSSTSPSIHNLLLRLIFPWPDRNTGIVVNGSTLAPGKDYFETDWGIFFQPPGEFSGTLNGTVSFDGRSDYRFGITTAMTVDEQLESLYAQTLNVRSFATAMRSQLATNGKTAGQIGAFVHSLLLTAFYARGAVIAEIETAVDPADWDPFAERVRGMPALLDL